MRYINLHFTLLYFTYLINSGKADSRPYKQNLKTVLTVCYW